MRDADGSTLMVKIWLKFSGNRNTLLVENMIEYTQIHTPLFIYKLCMYFRFALPIQVPTYT